MLDNHDQRKTFSIFEAEFLYTHLGRSNFLSHVARNFTPSQHFLSDPTNWSSRQIKEFLLFF